MRVAGCRQRLAVYGARQIAFLFYLPISGTSFTMAHYADDGASFYYEYSCLYKTDAYTDGEPESPATFAHEILHLFGAPDFTRAAATPMSMPPSPPMSRKPT